MIDRIKQLGDDALQNMYDLVIGDATCALAAIATGIDPNGVTARVKNLTIPASGNEFYDVDFKTFVVSKPSGKVKNVTEFSFTIRVDRLWALYKAFIVWKNKVSNQVTGEIGPDNFGGTFGVDHFRLPITVYPVTGKIASGQPEKALNFGMWTFIGCVPSEVGDVSFDSSSGDPVEVDITMKCLTLDDTALGNII